MLYFLPDRALEVLQNAGDLFAPVLDLKQELPHAFESSHLHRHLARSHSELGSTRRAGQLLHMPAASSQGGRKLFSVIKTSGAAYLKLRLSDEEHAWELPEGVPSGRNRSRDARQASGELRVKGEEHVGTFELIEGSLGKGYLDLFLTSEELKGEWLLKRVERVETGEPPVPRSSKTRADTSYVAWSMRRPSGEESGLRFEMAPGAVRVEVPSQNSVKAKKKKFTAEYAENAEKTGRRGVLGDEQNTAIVLPWKKDLTLSLDRLPAAKPAFAVPISWWGASRATA